MNEDLRNIEEAARLGWRPEDFGVTTFGPKLERAIKSFQRERFLPQTGIADRRTWRALKNYRVAIRDSEHQRRREDGLRELGSSEGYDPARVDRSSRFANIIIEDEVKAGRILRLDFDLLRKRAGGWLKIKKGDAVIVAVAPDLFPAFLSDLDVVEEALKPTSASAIMTSVSARGMSKSVKRKWKRLGSIFDAALPVVPGVFSGSPVEYAIGKTVATWSIFAHIRPTFCLPVYARHAHSTAQELRRLRFWTQRRGIRGLSLSLSTWYSFTSVANLERRSETPSLSDKQLREAWDDPATDRITRIDYF